MSTQENNFVPLNEVIVQQCSLPGLGEKNIHIDVLRLDKIHPVISGNKWFKLKYYFENLNKEHYGSILTFGGAWSNHIIATAHLARLAGLQSVGVIRGERPSDLSATLLAAQACGMNLHFISRNDYSRKKDDDVATSLLNKFGNPYIIPEGGAGSLGVRGSEEILSLSSLEKYSHIICCMGTGTMYTGIVHSSLPHQEVIGIPVLKGITYSSRQFAQDSQKERYCNIFQVYHFGGYAKKTPELLRFMNYFYCETGIPSDFVYTGKLFFACHDLIQKNYFPSGSKILVIHSGGLQGNTSLPEGTLLF